MKSILLGKAFISLAIFSCVHGCGKSSKEDPAPQQQAQADQKPDAPLSQTGDLQTPSNQQTGTTPSSQTQVRPKRIVRWAQVENIVSTNCSRCHQVGTRRLPEITSYASTQALFRGTKVSIKMREQLVQGLMPHDDPDKLPSADKALLLRWIDDGAQQ